MMKLHKQTGVAAVELALILIPMLILCFGVVEVGRALYYYDGLVKATRGAARYLTGQDLNAMTSTTEIAAQSLAVCGQTSCAGKPELVPGLNDLSQVVVTPQPSVLTGRGGVSLVTVTISGVRFTTFLPYTIASFTFSPVKLTMAWRTT